MNDNAKKWVEALESGEFEQGTGYLCKNNKYCCLGVACELYSRENGEMSKSLQFDGSVAYGINDYHSRYTLISPVRDWLGLRDGNSTYGKENNVGEREHSLMGLNDKGTPFTEIAAVIKSEPEGLFNG